MPGGRDNPIVEDTSELVILPSHAPRDEFRGRGRNGAVAPAARREARPDSTLLDASTPPVCGEGAGRGRERDARHAGVPIALDTGASEITGVDTSPGKAQSTETHGDSTVASHVLLETTEQVLGD